MRSRNPATIRILLAAALVAIPAGVAHAQGAKLGAEFFQFIAKKFGKEIAEEGGERFAGRLANAVTKYGDDLVGAAVRKVGPKALKYADEVGDALAPRALGLLSRHGDDAATFVLARPKSIGLFRRYGDDCAEALIRHRGAAEELIEAAGKPAIRALKGITGRGGRRLAMMSDAGELARIGRTDEVMAVIGRYGEKACTFVWENRSGLAAGAALAAFLSDPKPFLDGTTHLVDTAAEHIARPAVASAGRVAEDAAHVTLSWLVPVALFAGLGGGAVAYLRRKRPVNPES